MLAGAASDDGKADTYLLSTAAGTLPSAFAQRANANPLLAPAATAYRGAFYVMAASTVEPYRVFGATAVETVDQPGDAAVKPVDPEDPVDPVDPVDPIKPLDPPTPTAPDTPSKATALARTGDFTAPVMGLLVLVMASALATGFAVRRRR